MKIYAVNFNTETFKIESDIHEIQYSSLDNQYDKLTALLNAEHLDVLDYNDDIAILVDDRGFEKSLNPVFQILTEDNITCKLAGTLLFVRNIYNEDSTDFGSITYEDIFHLRRLLNITLLGMTN